MTTKPDPYASEAETQALPAPVQHAPVAEILDRLEVFVGGLGKAIFNELRGALAAPVQPDPMQHYITPLMEQQMFDDWCPYKGNPDPRTVWAAAIDSANGLLLGASGALHRTSALAQQPAQQQKMTHQQAAQLIREMAEQPAPVQGWKLVPLDANDTMIDSFENFIGRDISGFRQAYQAMLNAAPQPAQQQLAATITITQRGPIRIVDNNFDDCVRDWPDGEYKLYTSPQPTAQPLTDEQREEIAKGWRGRNWTVGDIIDATEAAHHIKENT